MCKICNYHGEWDESKINWDLVLYENVHKSASFSNETYGEIKFHFVTVLIDHLKITKNDVFYDLGSGIGNVVMQVSMDSGCKAIGIEKDIKRHQTALRLLAQCDNIKPGLADRVILWHKDLIWDDIDIMDASVIFMNNWCFSQELELCLLDYFSTLKSGTIVVCLKNLFGARQSTNSRKRCKSEEYIQLKEIIKGPKDGVSWTNAQIDCYIYCIT